MQHYINLPKALDVWELGDHPNLSCAELSPVIWDLYSKRVSYLSRNTSPFGLVCKMHFQINTSTTVYIIFNCVFFFFLWTSFFLPWPFLRKNLWHSFRSSGLGTFPRHLSEVSKTCFCGIEHLEEFLQLKGHPEIRAKTRSPQNKA